MSTGHFIITGTSGGIGEQVAKLLLEAGNFVYGVSRRDSAALEEYENYFHTRFDLSDVMGIDDLMSGIMGQMNEEISRSRPGMLGLINNAAMLEPLKSIDQCTAEEISKNVQTSLIAPMVLTSCFIRLTDTLTTRRKIINISSGSGTYPIPGMSVYCTAKAGINMFTQCVGAEQANRHNPVEILAFDPGMVDTDMQKLAREKTEQEFETAAFFKQAHETGQLQSTEELAKRLVETIYRSVEPGKLVR